MTVTVPRQRLAALLAAVQRGERRRVAALSLVFVGAAQIRKLNHQFRGKSNATDVLSFPLGDERDRLVTGEIYICVPVANTQARAYQAPLGVELARLFLHALLHLYGYDHMVPADARRMRSRERRYWQTAFGDTPPFPE